MKRRILTFGIATMLLCMVPCVGSQASEYGGYKPDGGVIRDTTVTAVSNGDANEDLSVDIRDLIAIKKYATGYTANQRITWRGDMYCNGRIDDEWDMHLIRRTLLERDSLKDLFAGIILDPDTLARDNSRASCYLEVVDIWREGQEITVTIQNTSTAYESSEEEGASLFWLSTTEAPDTAVGEKLDVGLLLNNGETETITRIFSELRARKSQTTVNIKRTVNPTWTVPVL